MRSIQRANNRRMLSAFVAACVCFPFFLPNAALAKWQVLQRPRLLDRLRPPQPPQDGPVPPQEARPRLFQPGGLLGERPNSDQPLGDRLSNLVDAVEKRIEMGQRIAGMFGGAPSAQIVTSEAVIGQTYNVGHVVYRLTPEDSLRWQARAIFVSDPENRVLYPSIMPTFLQRLGSQFTDKPTDPPRDIDIWFVFVGRQPINLTIHAAQDHRLTIEPANVGRVRQNSMMQTWWQQFELMLKEQVAASDYPPLAQAYLETMIQQRMGLANSGILPPKAEAKINPLTETWNLLTSAESLQVDNLKAMMRDRSLQLEPANQPLPANIAWQPHQFTQVDPAVVIEPIAMCVPHECFYLRFGNWGNQVWLKQLLDEHGGDLGRMVRLRGYQSLVGDLFRDQLAMESSQLDDLLGGTLIQDVAVIGLDTFLSEGAAAGLVLHSRNGLLLASLAGKRKDYAAKNANWGVTLNEIPIGDTTSTILQSPDGRVRSILVSAGEFHLVTTSYVLAQRFLQAAAGQASLGQSAEFRQARTQMPLTRDDTIFAYLSTAFLENMLSPQYQIELRRRQRSITEIQMLQMATWSAAAHQAPVPGGFADWEQVPLDLRIQGLKESGFLPNNFNRRSDASQVGLLAVPKMKSNESPPNEIGAPKSSDSSAPDAVSKEKSGANLLNSVVGSFFGNRRIDNSNDGSAVQPASGSATGESQPGEILPPPKNQPATARVAPPKVLWKDLPVGEYLYGDTLRGVRGWMIPVADMKVDRVTVEESQWYQERAKYFEAEWRQTDPLMIGVKRFAMKGARERVVFDARVAPFASQRYGWLMDRIGPPLTVRPAANPDDVIRLELSMAPSSFLQNIPAHLLFAAVQRDAQQLQNLDPSEWWTTLKLLKSTPGYIATWPASGLLNMFPMLASKPDAQGFNRSQALGIWRLQQDGFSAVAADRERLERLKPYLQMVESETPAQARLEIGDLAQSQLEGWVNTLWRQRSWQASLANTRLLHLLMQHFHLEPGTARQRAQSLLNAELVCSLDGNYLLWGPQGPVGDMAPEASWTAPARTPPMEEDRNFEALPALPPPPPQPVAFAGLHPFSYYWISDRWPADTRVAAQAWGTETSPLLSWFRGAMVEVNQEDSRFLLHGYLDINRKEKDTAALPGIELFKGFSWK
ncbi:MAG: hypothetical protein Q8M16_23490 [Pirellulaceae bacterium]|nr:hypothetical protein [Pirellulaceae bacterium]